MNVRPLLCLLASLWLATSGKLATAADAPASNSSPAATSKGVPPTLREVRYGPFERNVLNFWAAKSDRPTPVIFRIHGGGWIKGDMLSVEPPAEWLDRGISVVSIRYRLTVDGITLPAPLVDAARALQFVRSKAREWNIDPKRIICTGGSAGGCSTLWLALHDDLADPSSADPVARESTKPLAGVALIPQTTLDPHWIGEHIGPQALRHPMTFQTFGADSAQEILDHYDKYRNAIHEYSPITHMSRGDPPLYLELNADMTVPAKDSSHGIHHPMFGIYLKEAADAVGVPCYLAYRGRQGQMTVHEFVDDVLKKSGYR